MMPQSRILALALSITAFANPAPAADLWENVAKQAWQKHGKKMAVEHVREQVKIQVTKWLNDLKGKAPAEYHKQLNMIGHVVISAQNLDAFVDAVVTGKPADLEKASAELATVFGRQVAALASKEEDRGAALINWLAQKSSKVKAISVAAGSASEGDLSKAAAYIGGELIEYVAPAANPWIKVVQSAYGSMKFVRDAYTDSTLEGLYQQYKKILDEKGPDAAAAWVHQRFTIGGSELNALRNRMAEIRKAREEAFAETGLKGDNLKDVVSEEALIRNIIETMRARREKETAAATNAENQREAERRARLALETLDYEMIRRHGNDWLNKVTFTPEMLDTYLTEVERLIREDGLTEYEAAGLAARRLAHGLNSDQVRDFIEQINEERKRTGRKAIILSTRAGIITQANPLGGVKAIAPNTVLTAVAGNWELKRDADPAKVFGPFDVPHGGKLKAHITGDPPVPNEWSLYNFNSSLAISFEPKVGLTYGPAQSLLTLSGQTTNNKLAGEASWSGPGRITVVCGPPRGAGPISGCQYKQTFNGQVVVAEALPDTRPLAGRTLEPGDRLTLGGAFSETILRVGGSRVRAGNNADLTLKLRDNAFGGAPYLEQRGGDARVVNPPGSGAPPLSVHLVLKGLVDSKTKTEGPAREYRVKPRGSDYETVISHGNQAIVTVFHGAVIVTDSEGLETWLNAGQALQLPIGTIGETLLSRDRGCLLWDTLRIEQLPVNADPQPYGVIEGRFDGSKVGGEWVWQDPGADVTIETPKPGTLKLTVPNGNDFGGNVDQAPRLLHKATGDFDLFADVRVECKGRDNAIFDFLVLSPGSYCGYLANQFQFDGHLPHYRKLGGWWMQQGLNKLEAFNRSSPQDRPDAPEKPVKFRLSRRGDEFTGQWSLDGKNWTLFLREILLLPDTHWVGGAFNRMAWDRLPDEKATFTLSDVTLVTAGRGKLANPESNFAKAEASATAADNQNRYAIAGTWSGPWTNSLGEKGNSTLKLSENSDGKLTGTWDGIEVSGKRIDGNTIELRGKTKTRSYQMTGTIAAGRMTLRYLATRLDAGGSYHGTATLTGEK